MPEPIRFRYTEMSPKGRPLQTISRKGVIDENGVHLRQKLVPAGRLLGAAFKQNIAVIYVEGEDGQPREFALTIYRLPVARFANAVNGLAARGRVERERAQYEAEGRAHEFRTADCPCCKGPVNLSAFDLSPEHYCPYCGHVAGSAAPIEEQERVRMCDKCGVYAMPHDFLCFYFVFTGAFFGFFSQRKRMCGPCMRGEAWKMLAANLPFLLGVPNAVRQLRKVYQEGSEASEAYRGLEPANTAARKQQTDEALAGYDQIAERLEGSAVMSYNRGMALARAGRAPEATAAFEDALVQASNFFPAAMALADCLERDAITLDNHPLLAPFREAHAEKAQPEPMVA